MIQHDEYENKSYYYEGDTLVATLDFNTDKFELHDDEEYSNCCGADRLYDETDLCAECKEHADFGNGYTKEELDKLYFEMYQHREDIYNIVVDFDQFSYKDFR